MNTDGLPESYYTEVMIPAHGFADQDVLMQEDNEFLPGIFARVQVYARPSVPMESVWTVLYQAVDRAIASRIEQGGKDWDTEEEF